LNGGAAYQGTPFFLPFAGEPRVGRARIGQARKLEGTPPESAYTGECRDETVILNRLLLCINNGTI
jgi:hypothetical protein